MVGLLINDVFCLCFNIEKSSRSRRKRDLNRDADEWEYRFDNVSLIDENKSLNDEFFEIIDRKIDR